MKLLFAISLIFAGMLNLQAQKGLNYFLPKSESYDAKIPTPESFLGYQVGEWHVTHDQLVQYMKKIAEVSNRVNLEVIGHTYENRPLVHLMISSPENLARLDQILKAHRKLADPALSGTLSVKEMPAVVLLGYTIHGNEASGVNSSLLTAYYLAAARSTEMDNLLKNTIIIVDPCLNPDGYTRFSTWVNLNKSQVPNPDPNGREFKEYWPGGRTNHYWFDMNRDYLLLVNPETKSRVRELQKWLPNVVTDHHEMGSDATFFFQPGIPSRNNPLTPERNYDLTRKIASYHAKALNRINSLYYSDESFDDYYFGKGSSYPDINSGIGILFEQASIRGSIRETENGIIDFPFAIRNQFTATLSTLEAVKNLKDELLTYQRDFYLTAKKEAINDPVKAYIFGGQTDKERTFEFSKRLQQQHINMFHLKKDIIRNGHHFKVENSFIVPVDQQNYRLIKTLFEPVHHFNDSSFYDVSTWDLPMSFNLPMARIKNLKVLAQLKGTNNYKPQWPSGILKGMDHPYAWAFKWTEYYSPRALSDILSHGIFVKVSQGTFKYKDNLINEKFGYGTILIPTQNQQLSSDEIEKLLLKIAQRDGLVIYRLKTGWNPEGIDLGSRNFSTLKEPKIAMITGNGVRSSDAGEIWHLFDTRYNTPLTLLDIDQFNRTHLARYNVLILPGGSYTKLGKNGAEKIKSWVKEGGTLIAYKSAARWASENKLASITFKNPVKIDQTANTVYANRRKVRELQMISGAIFETTLDLTHPLAYGFTENKVPVFKNSTEAAMLPKNLLECPILYSENSLLSGYASQENIQRINGSPFLFVQNYGEGRIISILDNTNFRGIWYGTNKIFTNAVFFGQIIGSR